MLSQPVEMTDVLKVHHAAGQSTGRQFLGRGALRDVKVYRVPDTKDHGQDLIQAWANLVDQPAGEQLNHADEAKMKHQAPTLVLRRRYQQK